MEDSIFLHRGGIRGLFSLDGVEVSSVDDLIDGEAYVATCLSEPFKHIVYPVQSRTMISQSMMSTTVIKTKSMSSLRRRPSACSTLSMEAHRGPSGQVFRPRYITIIQADDRDPRRIFRMHLNNSNASHLQMVMDRISQHTIFEGGKPLHRVFMESCAEVKCLEDFFGNFFVFFACPKCTVSWEMFDITTDEDAFIGKLNEVPFQTDAWMNILPASISAKYEQKRVILGSGFTVVHECVERATYRRLALKMARRVKSNPFAESFVKPMLNEMNILSELNHPNVLSLFCTAESPDRICSVMEFFDGGTLRSAIFSGSVRHDEYLPLMENIASALAYLHLRRICHRDLCPATMMLRQGSRNRTLVLTDFNQAIKINGPLYDYGGFLLFMAPEMVSRKGYGLKADIWSAGVALYFMVTKSLPFDGKNVDFCTRQILKLPIEYDQNQWNDTDVAIKMLTDIMLCRDPYQRPSAADVLAFIANVRDGNYHQYELERYCNVEMEGKRNRRRRSRSTSDADTGSDIP